MSAAAISVRPRRARSALIGALSAGVVGAVLIGILATRGPAPQVVASTALLGKKAPEVSGASIDSGVHLSLSLLRGRFVILVFFASWCTPCTDEVPQLESFLFDHAREKNVAVLGVDIDDSSADGAAFLRRTGATFAAIEDTSGALAERYGVADPPQSFVVSPSGVVLARILSGVTASGLDRLLGDHRRAGV